MGSSLSSNRKISNQSLERCIQKYIPTKNIINLIVDEYLSSFESSVRCGLDNVLGNLLEYEHQQNNLHRFLSSMRENGLLTFCLQHSMFSTIDIMCEYFNLYLNCEERLAIVEKYVSNNAAVMNNGFKHIVDSIRPCQSTPTWNNKLFNYIVKIMSNEKCEFFDKDRIEQVIFPLDVDMEKLGIHVGLQQRYLFNAVKKNQVSLLHFLLARMKPENLVRDKGYCQNDTWRYVKQSILQYVCSRNNRNMVIVQMIVSYAPALINQYYVIRNEQHNCLTEATIRKDYELMEFLIHHGANLGNYREFL